MPKFLLPLFLVTAIGLSVFLVQQRTNILPKAQERVDTGACRDNPDVAKKAVDDLNNAQTGNQNFYYKWIAFCSNSCSQNSDCAQNTDDPDRINPGTSSWCYGFGDGTNKCLKLVAMDKSTNRPATTTTGRNPATGSTFSSSPGPSSSTTGSKDIGRSCDQGSECKSGVCTNNKCAQGTKPNGAACTSGNECQSKTCTNGKCTASTTNNTTNNTNNTTNNSTNNTTNGDKGELTKAEITGFKSNYDALYAKLGSAKDSGNLKVVSTTAEEELESIISEFTKCPDDNKVGKCLDKNFGKRFDYAKTAARLSAFYAIFNGVAGVCVKSDFGLNPLISASNGRVVLCSDNTGSTKVWKTFSQGQFSPLTDSKFPASPTCATLPADVLTHYRNAEKLVTGQEGFIENTKCDGKTP